MRLFCAIVFVVGFVTFAIAQETNATIHAIFKDYDGAFLSKITDHWFESLDSAPPKTPLPAGKVVVEFHLYPDGHISDLTGKSSTVEESYVALCKKAVTNSAPFESWSPLIRLAYASNRVRFRNAFATSVNQVEELFVYGEVADNIEFVNRLLFRKC